MINTSSNTYLLVAVSKSSVLKQLGIKVGHGYYLVPRTRTLPVQGWIDHHKKEKTKINKCFVLFESGVPPTDTAGVVGFQKRSEHEKKRKLDEIIIEMKTMIEEGHEKEAFAKFPRNFLTYGEKLKAMINQKRDFFKSSGHPHIWITGPPGSGKSAILQVIYPTYYNKDLNNRFFDLYSPEFHTHVLLQDLDHQTIEKLGVQFIKTLCDEAGFPIDQKYKTPQLTRTTALVSSNFGIQDVLPEDMPGRNENLAALRRRFFEVNVSDFLRLLGLKLLSKYEITGLKLKGNLDPRKLFIHWDYLRNIPTGEEVPSEDVLQKLVKDAYYVALKHDIGYDKLLKMGRNPYIEWNEADEEALRDFTWKDYGGALGKAYFGMKRLTLGPRSKRLREEPNISPQGKPKQLRGNDIGMERPASIVEREIASVSNNPPGDTMSATTADGGGSGNGQGLKETPVDDPYVVYRGPPDYTFCSLPYVEARQNLLNATSSPDAIWRMTSVYDCRVETTFVDINVGAGIQLVSNEAEAGQRKARWFDYYSSLYNYYHVVGCRWYVMIENLSGEPFWPGVKYKYCDRRFLAITTAGQVEQGEGGVNEQLDEAMTPQPLDVFETTNHVTGNVGSGKVTFQDEYRPGDFKREIRLDSQVENWTTVATNPALPEKLLIRIKPTNERTQTNSVLNAGDTLRYKIVAKLNYLVEFKELKTELRYPVVRQPLTITLNSNIAAADH
ncbi:putative parvovirus coat protein VP1 [Plasmopara halstedii]